MRESLAMEDRSRNMTRQDTWQSHKKYLPNSKLMHVTELRN